MRKYCLKICIKILTFHPKIWIMSHVPLIHWKSVLNQRTGRRTSVPKGCYCKSRTIVSLNEIKYSFEEIVRMDPPPPFLENPWAMS